jgi:hypothetical protein
MERQRHSQDEDRGAGDWFARNLGPNWRATGDGIYHLAEDIVTPDDADAPEARGPDTHEPNDASEPLWREQSQDNIPEQPPPERLHGSDRATPLGSRAASPSP